MKQGGTPTRKRDSEMRYREIVVESVRGALRAGQRFPADDEDLLKSGALDSMGWVAVLENIEEAAGVRDLPDPAEHAERGDPCSIAALVAALERSSEAEQKDGLREEESLVSPATSSPAIGSP